MNEEDEKKDPEQELKEARDQYEAENQQIYDEVTKGNEEFRRRKEQKRTDTFEAQKELQEDDVSAQEEFDRANRGFDVLYQMGKTADKYIGTKGTLGELFDWIKGKTEGKDLPFPTQLLLKEQKDLPIDDTKGILPEGDETNFLSRIYSTGRSGIMNLPILENLQAMISRTLTTTRRKLNPTPNKLRELLGKGTSGQQTLFSQMADSVITPEQAVQQETEEENNFNQKQYDIAKQFLFEEKPPQPFKVSKRDIRKLKQQARRPLKLIDVKRVQAKLNDPNITDEVVLNYFLSLIHI